MAGLDPVKGRHKKEDAYGEHLRRPESGSGADPGGPAGICMRTLPLSQGSSRSGRARRKFLQQV